MDAVEVLWGSLVIGLALLFVFKGFLLKEHGAKLPPGSFGWPFIGDTIFFVSCWRRNNLAHFFNSKAQSYGPVFKTSIFGIKTAVLPAPEGTTFMYTNENRAVQGFWPGAVHHFFGEASLLSMVGEEHRKTKNLVIASLRPEILKDFVGQMSRVALDHLDKFWMDNTVVRVHDMMKKFTFHLSCNLLVGLPTDDEVMQAMAQEFNTLGAGLLNIQLNYPGSPFRKAKAARKVLDSILEKQIAKRKHELKLGKASPKQDLLSILLTVNEQSGMPNADEFIKDNLVTLLYAGHDTSSSTLTSVFRYLAANPSCMDKVVQEQVSIAREKKGEELNSEDLKKMKYTWQVIQETLRLSPVVQATYRKAIVDMEWDGFTIPKGWQVLCYTSGPHKDNQVFDNPTAFHPSRFDTADQRPKHAFAPFGGGARICPGYDFAKTEMLVFLHHCVLKFTWDLVDPSEKLVADPVARPVQGMPVHVHARAGCMHQML